MYRNVTAGSTVAFSGDRPYKTKIKQEDRLAAIQIPRDFAIAKEHRRVMLLAGKIQTILRKAHRHG